LTPFNLFIFGWYTTAIITGNETTMDFLTKLFSSAALPKVLRLFVLNPGVAFDKEMIVERTRVHPDDATYEIGLLSRCGLLRKKAFIKEEDTKGVTKSKKKRVTGYVLDERSPYIGSVREFLLGTTIIPDADIARKISHIGKIKLIVTAGVFLGEWERRVDLLIVGEHIEEGKLNKVVRELESYLGREIRYSTFGTADYRYRRNLKDRLLRDIFDFPHTVILDRLG
jgi:hypothetical protein